MTVKQKVFSSLSILWGVLFFCCGAAPASVEKADTKKAEESFETVQGWSIIKPAGTKLDLTSEKGIKGNALSLNYDLGDKKLYGVVTKEIQMQLPENYEFTFYVKGESPDNHLEFKLKDGNGNIFLKRWENFRVKNFWQKMVVSKKDLTYGWGPIPGAQLTSVKSLELAVNSGSDVIGRPAPGGKGALCIDELTLTALEKVPETGKSLLRNPGFEDGAQGWEISGNAKHKGPFPFQKYEGQKSCGLGNDEGPDGASGMIFQKMALVKPVKEGDIFIFSMWVKGEEKFTGKAALSLDFLDSAGKMLQSYSGQELNGKFDWKKASVAGAAPAGADSIRVNCTSKEMRRGEGGSFVWFDGGELDKFVVGASSLLGKEYSPENVILGQGYWKSMPAATGWISVNFGRIKKFSGIEIAWGEDYAKGYELLISNDGEKWKSVYSAEKESGGSDTIYLDQTYASHLKIECGKSKSGNGFAIKSIKIKESDELMTIKNYFKMMAKESPGCFPRWMLNQQVYWATVGTYGDVEEALLGEDGGFEPHKYGYSVTPFIHLNGTLLTRDDAKVSHALEGAYLPIPSVEWKVADLDLKVKLFTHGKAGESVAYARYTIENKSGREMAGKLFLAIRPLQVYPPWQENTDSFSPIHTIELNEEVVKINNDKKLYPLIKPDGSGVMKGGQYFKFPFKTPPPPELPGDITLFLKKGELPDGKSVLDMEGFASGALAYNFNLKPGEKAEYFLAAPLHAKEPAMNSGMGADAIRKKYDDMLAEDVKFWKSKIDIVDINIPEMDLVNMMKANIGYNLVTKDGPALQPGARSYEKAWWRDGSIQASSLLKMGLTKEAGDYINFLVGYQYESGEVPPIIDTRALDPLWEEKMPTNLKEYDSQGEMIWAILEYYMFSHDIKFLESKWDNIYRNLQFMKGLREKRLTKEYPADDPDKGRFRGILPQSRSHEGYWFEHSYWDDWWAVKGWKDALDVATILGKERSVRKWIEQEYESFYRALCASVIATAKFKKVNYISGCAEKGDYDPTSVAVAINYAGLLPRLKKDLQPYLDNTFDTYYKDHLSPKVKPGASFHYTPYEARNAPALIYMGHKDRALMLIRFLLSCSRPYEWFQLAEVVNSDPRLPYYLGDMPHTWCGAEFMNSVRGLFVYEEFGKIILGAGIDEKWLAGKEGIYAKNMPTYFGTVNYSVAKEGNLLKVKIWGDAKPEKGFVFKSPFSNKKLKSVTVNGASWNRFVENEITFKKLPVTIEAAFGD